MQHADRGVIEPTMLDPSPFIWAGFDGVCPSNHALGTSRGQIDPQNRTVNLHHNLNYLV
jgi:hypothetical protein